MKALLAVLICATLLPARTQAVAVMVEGAVDFELQPLLEALSHKRRVQIAAWTFWTGSIGSRRVVVVRTEMGPMNASAATALGISRFHPRVVINQGTAGAHIPSLNVFDIVIGKETVDYGAVRSNHGDAGAGIHVKQWLPMGTELRLDGEHTTRFERFAGDSSLYAQALRTAYSRGHLVDGIVGSAYQFNRELDYIEWVHGVFHTSSEDMESAFAAGVSQAMGTPFLAVRIISDSEYNHPALEKIAGQYCAQFVVDMIRGMH